MTIEELLVSVDELQNNSYTDREKIGWLNDLDGRVYKYMQKFEGTCGCEFSRYSAEDKGAELLLPAPYDDCYKHWLTAQIHLWSGDIPKYNNFLALFASIYDEWKKEYMRDHAPKPSHFNYIH